MNEKKMKKNEFIVSKHDRFNNKNLSECFKQHPCSKHYLCRSNAVGGWDVIAVVIDRA